MSKCFPLSCRTDKHCIFFEEHITENDFRPTLCCLDLTTVLFSPKRVKDVWSHYTNNPSYLNTLHTTFKMSHLILTAMHSYRSRVVFVWLSEQHLHPFLWTFNCSKCLLCILYMGPCLVLEYDYGLPCLIYIWGPAMWLCLKELKRHQLKAPMWKCNQFSQLSFPSSSGGKSHYISIVYYSLSMIMALMYSHQKVGRHSIPYKWRHL